MKNLVIYIHGKGGNAGEADHYKTLFAESEIIGFDYKSQNPWEAKTEFKNFYEIHRKGYSSVTLIANSIGAYFAMTSLYECDIDKAFFISPIVNMEKLISDMMTWANVSEQELSEKREIQTDFGEVLSWEYLCYVRKNPIKWNIPTFILYGDKDNLTSQDTVTEFANNINVELTVMSGGEHWFHTDEQMNFLDKWIKDINRVE